MTARMTRAVPAIAATAAKYDGPTSMAVSFAAVEHEQDGAADEQRGDEEAGTGDDEAGTRQQPPSSMGRHGRSGCWVPRHAMIQAARTATQVRGER